MKAVIVEKKTEEEPKFPCVMRSSLNDCMVLFHKPNCGITLAKGDEPNTYLGEYSARWRMDNFRPIQGTVTLEND